MNMRIRKVSPSGIITTVAGSGPGGRGGFSGDGGPATAAQLSYPEGVAADPSGIIYICDSSNNRIRAVSLSGIITTIAGSGPAGGRGAFGGDGGPATAAQLNYPFSVAIGPSGTIYFSDEGNERVRELSVAPTIISGVTNAASGATGPIAPGEIISIFGNASPIGPTPGVGLQLDVNGNIASALGGVRVRFMGINAYAPLTFVSAGQINAVVPYEVAGLADVQIQVEYLGGVSNPFPLQVGATAPGIFTANGTGTGQGAILNHDGITFNGPTNPEPRGGTVVLFLTGEGQTAPAGVSGKVTTVSSTPPFTPTPMSQVSALINGQLTPVTFSGEAPGLVSGVLQLNVTIPATISPGNVPLRVVVGGKSTQSVVTVSVQSRALPVVAWTTGNKSDITVNAPV